VVVALQRSEYKRLYDPLSKTKEFSISYLHESDTVPGTSLKRRIRTSSRKETYVLYLVIIYLFFI
jgi:hypothetical protein